jgi:predicted dehydrogenase
VGLGSIGQRHLKNLRKLTDEPILAYRTNPKKNKDFIKRHGARVFSDFSKALAEKPDAVFITNPTSRHLPYALRAAKQGCHLFIEKPISGDLKGVDNLFKIIKKKKTICQVAFQLRFHPNLRLIKKLIENKKIGKVLFARIEVGQYLPDWHPGEDYRVGYAAKRDLGGGVILTLIHELDYAYWLFGAIESVGAFADKISSLEIEAEDIAAIIAKTKTGVILEIHLDCIQRPMGRSCQIVGEKGKLEWDYLNSEVRLFSGRNGQPKIYRADNFEKNEMYEDELKYFLHCLKNKSKPRMKFKEIKEVMKFALAVKKSAKDGKIVKLKY